jgi:hypothetical protein
MSFVARITDESFSQYAEKKSVFSTVLQAKLVNPFRWLEFFSQNANKWGVCPNNASVHDYASLLTLLPHEKNGQRDVVAVFFSDPGKAEMSGFLQIICEGFVPWGAVPSVFRELQKIRINPIEVS